MATITKRGETFRIKVSLGYDANGKQIVKSTTFTPPTGVTPKKAEKLANEYAFEFERHCKGYAQLNENMRFSELAGALGDSFAHPEMVFTSANGNYRDRSALRTSFKRFLKGTEFEFLTLHQLRHCNATLLLNSGVDLKLA